MNNRKNERNKVLSALVGYELSKFVLGFVLGIFTTCLIQGILSWFIVFICIGSLINVVIFKKRVEWVKRIYSKRTGEEYDSF